MHRGEGDAQGGGGDERASCASPLGLPLATAHPISERRFAQLHIHLVDPLQYSNNCNYIFTIIDQTSKWMEGIPLSEVSAAACARTLLFSWITRFGVPETILPIVGCNLLQIFDHSIAKQPHTILSSEFE